MDLLIFQCLYDFLSPFQCLVKFCVLLTTILKDAIIFDDLISICHNNFIKYD